MKKTLFLFLLLFASLILPAREMILPMALAPLQGNLLQMSTWDFSQQWIAGDKAKTTICVYGDSLLAETYDGRRFWYDIIGDSLLYSGEEDRLTSISLDKPVYISSVPLSHGANNGSPVFSACGKGGGRQFSVSEFGSLEFASSAQPGVLILAPGDTISNVLAVRELRDITAYPTDDSLATTHLIAETYRWYDSDGLASLLPLAVQRSVYIGTSVSLASNPATSMAFLPERVGFDRRRQDDDGDINSHQANADAVEAALNAAVVTCDGRKVTVRVTMPQSELHLTVDIMDAAGRLYLHEDAFSSGTTDEMTLDCTSLRQGQYIVATGVEDIAVAPKKELIIIR